MSSNTALQVLGNLLEFVQGRSIALAQGCNRVLKTVVDMVLDERALGLADGLFNRMQLLGNVYTFPPVLDHGNDAAQMTVCTLQALDDRLMALVRMGMALSIIVLVIMRVIGHILSLCRRYITLAMLSPPGG